MATPLARVILGTNRRDTIGGTAGDDIIHALEGDDYIFGSTGADMIDGWGGNDTVDYGGSSSAVFVDLWATLQRGGDAERDQLLNIENIFGSGFDDLIRGSDGENQIRGGRGADALYGRGGDDTFIGEIDGARDVVSGGSGRDLIDYSGGTRGLIITLGDDTTSGTTMTPAEFVKLELFGRTYFQFRPATIEDDLISIEDVTGTRFNDVITGNVSVNRLRGGEGDDEIRAVGSGDTVIGGNGEDSLFRGDGPTTFLYNSFVETSVISILSSEIVGDNNGFDELLGPDTIFDFLPGEDTINLRGIDANSTLDGDQRFTFVDGDPRIVDDFSGQAGELVVELFSGRSTANGSISFWSVRGDIDGDRAFDFDLRVMTPTTLDPVTVADFIL
jgi:Ca2+-binding RTX toxin-like protein